MVFESLKVKPGQRASARWANTLIDAIEQIYWMGKRGDYDYPFPEFYGYYGYFFYDLQVQGKKVIKDGDPINVYDILEPARERITYAIDQSLLTQYMRETRDKVVKISVDEYGNIGVRIAEPLDEYGNVRTTPHEPLLRSIARDELAPKRTTPEKVFTSKTINGGGLEEFIVSNAEGYSAVVVAVKAGYDPNATAGVRVRWLYSPDGSNFDSPEDAEAEGNYEDLTFSAGKTRQRTVLIPIMAPYVKVQIVNMDSTYSVVVDVWKWLFR